MMTERLQMYKCDICGNMVQVILSGTGDLNCCGQNMTLLKPQYSNDETGEKHVPAIEYKSYNKDVSLKTHPMLPEHHIEFIEVIDEDNSEILLKYFKPGDIAELDINCTSKNVKAIEYCNIHGLWRNA